MSKFYQFLSVALLGANIANAQALPTLEIDYSIMTPIGPFPNANPITVPFSLDYNNDNTYVSPIPNPIEVTFSLANQQFVNRPYNLTTGLSFGGNPTLSTGGTVQQSGSVIPFDLFGVFINDGGPKSGMFTTSPFGTPKVNTFPVDTATGMDVDGNLFSNNLNGGVQLFTAAQFCYDDALAKDARVYFGDLIVNFSRPVKNPVIHFAGLGSSYRYLPFGALDIPANYQSTYAATELELQNTGVTSTKLSSNNIMDVVGNNILNNSATPNGGSTNLPNEAPFNNFGAGSGSVRVNGVVQTLTYKVFLKGVAASQFAWSADGFDPNSPAPQKITNATRDPFTGDVWYISASIAEPDQQITGNVYLDKDGLTDNDIRKSFGIENPKFNLNNQLIAYLINVGNIVIDSTRVSPDGSYLFDNVTAANNFRVLLSTIQYALGSTIPSSILNAAVVSTGEKNGLGIGSDMLADGISDFFDVNPGQVVNFIDFGIEAAPNSDNKTQPIPTPSNYAIPQGTATNVVSGLDPEQGALANADSIVIKTLPTNGNMFYNNIPVTVGTEINNFNPALLSYNTLAAGSTSVTFEYAFKDAANVQDPTPATYTLTWTIPLSINDVVLTGKAMDLANNIKWTSTYEDATVLKYDVFVKSSVDNAFKLAGSVKPNGVNYTFDDKNVQDNVTYTYYITVNTIAGKVEKSNNIVITRSTGDKVKVYPNPVVDVFTIEFTTETVLESKVMIRDVAGKMVKIINLPAGTTTSTIDISTLPKGVYNCTIENENLGAQTIKITKK